MIRPMATSSLPVGRIPPLPAGSTDRGPTYIDSTYRRPIRAHYDLSTLVALILGHMLLALAMHQFRPIATAHALAVAIIGLRFAIQKKKQEAAIYTLVYIGTCDVLWRMSQARVLWEFSKYLLVGLTLLMLLNRKGRKGLGIVALLYFVLLIPSAALTVSDMGFTNELRKALSFNLSGPLALLCTVAFFSGYAGRPPQLAKMLTWGLMPIVGTFTLAAYSTLTAGQLSFGNFANFVTSGGYGPNQVSGILGLGVFLSLILAIQIHDPWLRPAYLGLAAILCFQAILTFSRGGVFNVIIAMSLMGLHSWENPRVRKSFIAILIITTSVGAFLIIPRLDDWTQGKLGQRFTNLDTTGRQSLAEADVQLFLENPALGVGPGMSRFRRTGGIFYRVAAHTEFTRLLSEHGVLGIFALCALFLIAFQAYRLAPTMLAKGWVMGFVSWALANMAHSGMRLSAISLMFGLANLPFYYWSRQRAESLQNIERTPARG